VGGARRLWAQGVDSGWGCCLRGQWANLWGGVVMGGPGVAVCRWACCCYVGGGCRL
jgi:hypothetical protein